MTTIIIFGIFKYSLFAGIMSYVYSTFVKIQPGGIVKFKKKWSVYYCDPAVEASHFNIINVKYFDKIEECIKYVEKKRNKKNYEIWVSLS